MNRVTGMTVDRSSGVPIGTQLAWQIRSRIDRGELEPGEQLPSLRDVAAAADVNVNTVRAVYAKLEAAGIVTTEQGRGTFVAPLAEPAGSARRRELSEEIARLEAELVNLPLLPLQADADQRPVRPSLLSVEDLTAIRNVLADRIRERRATRAEIVERIGQDEPASRPVPRSQAIRAAARRSSSSLAGARVRWTATA
jgi:GntR family transcriptional regulator